MIINQTNLNLVYPKIIDCRKKFVNCEEVLYDFFLPATILSVPDAVQEEIPRIVAQTKNGHSVLNVALSVATFTTNYNNDYVSDWNKCKDYLEKRCSDVYNIIDYMTNSSNTFVGLVTNVEFDDLCENGLEVLKKSLCKDEAQKMGNIYDLAYKLTYVYKDKYYINITVQNSRKYSVEHFMDGRSIILGEQGHTVSASIDINDRYAANKDKNYKSKKTDFDEILNITSEIIDGKLDKLVKEGEFSYDK